MFSINQIIVILYRVEINKIFNYVLICEINKSTYNKHFYSCMVSLKKDYIKLHLIVLDYNYRFFSHLFFNK